MGCRGQSDELTIASSTKHFTYNGDGLLATHDPNRTQVWDVAAGLPQVIQIERGGASPDTFSFTYGLGRIADVSGEDTTFYYLADALGSAKEIRNSAGSRTDQRLHGLR